MHRRYLDIIRNELSQLTVDDINAVQAMLLTNIQGAEVSIRELVDRGYYIGSNVTYNVRHLVETGYLEQNRSESDRRSVRIRLTAKGHDFCAGLAAMEARHAGVLDSHAEAGSAGADAAIGFLRVLERIWSDSLDYNQVADRHAASA